MSKNVQERVFIKFSRVTEFTEMTVFSCENQQGKEFELVGTNFNSYEWVEVGDVCMATYRPKSGKPQQNFEPCARRANLEF